VAKQPLQAVLQHIRKIAGVQALETLPDSGCDKVRMR
jgi:hypothetical protein